MTGWNEGADRRVQQIEDLDTLSFGPDGLLPVVAQDATSDAVLMLAFANREALEATLRTGEMHYWSRSRRELWRKGATSGNVQDLVSLHADCDGDALLARVNSRGPACHTGDPTCFGTLPLPKGPPPTGQNRGRHPAGQAVPSSSPAQAESTLPALWGTLVARAAARPPGSYTVRLLEDENLRLKKLGEEAAELILALGRGERERAAEEGADLTYHLLVALLAAGVTLDDLLESLARRMR